MCFTHIAICKLQLQIDYTFLITNNQFTLPTLTLVLVVLAH